MKKQCGRCGHTKPLGSFGSHGVGRVDCWCRECRRAYIQQWLAKNKERNRNQQRAYRIKHKVAIQQYADEWRRRNLALVNAREWANRQNNLARVRERARSWWKRLPERTREEKRQKRNRVQRERRAANLEIARVKEHDDQVRARTMLLPSYVKKVLVVGGVKPSEITEDLVTLKRAHLMLRRAMITSGVPVKRGPRVGPGRVDHA